MTYVGSESTARADGHNAEFADLRTLRQTTERRWRRKKIKAKRRRV